MVNNLRNIHEDAKKHLAEAVENRRIRSLAFHLSVPPFFSSEITRQTLCASLLQLRIYNNYSFFDLIDTLEGRFHVRKKLRREDRKILKEGVVFRVRRKKAKEYHFTLLCGIIVSAS